MDDAVPNSQKKIRLAGITNQLKWQFVGFLNFVLNCVVLYMCIL